LSELDKLRAEFLAESEETLEQLQRDVNGLEANAASPDPEVLDRAFRTAHSLKGVCGMFGLDSMLSVAHSLENLFQAFRENRIQRTPDVFDLLHRGVETLHGILAHERGRADGAPAAQAGDLIEQIEHHLASHVPASASAASAGPVPETLASLTDAEREAALAAVRDGRTLAVVEAELPREGFEEPFQRLLGATRSWGRVHGTASGEEEGDRFRLRVVVSGDGQLFALMKAVGPCGGEVLTGDAPPAVAPAPAAPGPIPARGGRPATLGSREILRVPVERVERLLSDLGEVLQAKKSLDAQAEDLLATCGDRLRRTEMTLSLRNLDRRIHVLQDEILRVRMVTLAPLFQRLERACREACRLTGKDVRLRTTGETVELDKAIVEALAEPLVHLVRNAVDHGIEDAATRRAHGKDPVGTVRIAAGTEGARTWIELSDDGAGLDFARILAKARAAGLLTNTETPSTAELKGVIFRPGFTVRDEAGALSGRGVGLDAVREAVAELGGVLRVDDGNPGTAFRIRIPTTLAVQPALLVRAAGQAYYLPLGAVARVLEIPRARLESLSGDEGLLVDEESVPVRDLGEMLGAAPVDRGRERIPAVLLGLADRRLVLLVDSLGRQGDIVVRSLGSVLPPVPGIAGSSESGNGETVLILDAAALFDPDFGRPARVGSAS